MEMEAAEDVYCKRTWLSGEVAGDVNGGPYLATGNKLLLPPFLKALRMSWIQWLKGLYA
jgi:hypothetical protein